jgi:hypothetical protein
MSSTYQFDEQFSAIVLGTTTSPGVVKLSGHDRVKNWDVQAAKGLTGASSKKNGDPIGTFQAEFYLVSDDTEEVDDFDRWDDFQRLLESIVDGPTPSALPIYHPDLARNHFTEVSVKSIGGMIHDGKGGAIIQVQFLEYKPPKPKPTAKATAKPDQQRAATSSGASSPAKPDPNADSKKELSDLVDQASAP